MIEDPGARGEAARTPVAEEVVFATAAFARVGSDEEGRLPGTTCEVHAKTMGTTLALCGASTLTWFKFYDLPFRRAPGIRCAACLEAAEALHRIASARSAYLLGHGPAGPSPR